MLFRGERLYGVKFPLVQLVLGVANERDITVTCGLRSVADQQAAVARGASQTMKSKHLTGDAVDLAVMVGGTITWEWTKYVELADAMKHYAGRHGVHIQWGGDWKTLKDGPHFELVGDGTVAV